MVEQLFADPTGANSHGSKSNGRSTETVICFSCRGLASEVGRHGVACSAGGISRTRAIGDRLASVTSVEWTEEVVSLTAAAAEPPKHLELLSRLDTLGDDVHAKVLSEGEDRLHDLKRLRVLGQCCDEGFIDLQT